MNTGSQILKVEAAATHAQHNPSRCYVVSTNTGTTLALKFHLHVGSKALYEKPVRERGAESHFKAGIDGEEGDCGWDLGRERVFSTFLCQCMPPGGAGNPVDVSMQTQASGTVNKQTKKRRLQTTSSFQL